MQKCEKIALKQGESIHFIVHLELGEAVSEVHLTGGIPAAALECSHCNGFLQGRHPCFP